MIARWLLSFLILTSCGQEIMPEKTAFYFIGGQSNANADFEAGVRAGLKERFPDNTPRVIRNNYSGKSIKFWYDSTIQKGYQTDTDTITTKVDFNKYSFEGVIWIQGGSDTRKPETRERFYDRTEGMIKAYHDEFGESIDFYVVSAYLNPEFDGMDGRYSENYEAIRGYQKQLGETYGTFVDTKDYERRDAVHMTKEEIYRLGYDIAFML